MAAAPAAAAFLSRVRSPDEAERRLQRGFAGEPDAGKVMIAEAPWDAQEGCPRAALAALALLIKVERPQDHPLAGVLVDEIRERFRS